MNFDPDPGEGIPHLDPRVCRPDLDPLEADRIRIRGYADRIWIRWKQTGSGSAGRQNGSESAGRRTGSRSAGRLTGSGSAGKQTGSGFTALLLEVMNQPEPCGAQLNQNRHQNDGLQHFFFLIK